MNMLPNWAAFDPSTDVLTICGIKYSAVLFRELSFLPSGQMFEIMERRDGVLTITKIDKPATDSVADLERRLRAISAALTGGANSTESEVMACIDSLTEYFTDLECAKSRFFLDHGVWHDRVTGQHMWNQDDCDRRYRDGLANGKALAEAALAQQTGAAPEPTAPLLIELGQGAVTVGEGHHGEDRLPAILFGRNGTGKVGEESEGDRFMEPGECIAAITFENPESLDVVVEKLHQLRARIWPTEEARMKSPADWSIAAHDVLAERRRQLEQENCSHTLDDLYLDRQLSMAAACYVVKGLNHQSIAPPAAWPWPWEWWKPADERRNLVKAGALIVADIERIDRAAAKLPKDHV